MNCLLIKAAIWMSKKGLLSLPMIHKGVIEFETCLRRMGLEEFPLTEQNIRSSFRNLGFIISPPMFEMWASKCWKLLDHVLTSDVYLLTKGKEELTREEQMHRVTQEMIRNKGKTEERAQLTNYTDYGRYMILPHEYLCLLCNAIDR